MDYSLVCHPVNNVRSFYPATTTPAIRAVQHMFRPGGKYIIRLSEKAASQSNPTHPLQLHCPPDTGVPDMSTWQGKYVQRKYSRHISHDQLSSNDEAMK